MFIELDKKYTKGSEALKTLVEQVYYLDHTIVKCNYKDGGLFLEFQSDSKVNEKMLKDDILHMSISVLKSFDRVETKIVFENDGVGKYDLDPLDELMNTRQAIETYPGVFALQGDILKCINRLDAYFKSFALDKGAIEQHFQPTLPAKSLVENGYISSFPQHPLFVANVFRNIKNINTLSKDAKEKPINSMHQWLDDRIDTHKQILSPTVCYHCFETLRNQSIPLEGVLYTAIAPCHRHESRNISGLSRLQTFTMREIIFFGSEDYVETNRNEIQEHCKSYFIDLGLKFRIVTASDPFFTSGAEAKRIYQSALSLKYEIQAYLPHSDIWISVASFNNHQQSLVTPYKINFDSNSDLYSGCVGYGYERLAYALYSQFGCDQSSWLLN
jgi:seryl-tRNA synthetase